MLFLITAASAKIEQHEGFPVSAGTGLKASLVAQDLDGDGKIEIIAAPENRKIKVFNHIGVLEWENIGGSERSDNSRVPLISNLSGDSRLEVLSYGNPGYSDPTYYMWDAAGGKLKEFWVGTNILISSPAITKEGIILTGAAPGISFSPIAQYTGVYAFDTQGNKLYLELGKSVNYMASISIGDIDGDGIDEAVILTQDIVSKNPVDGKVWVIKVNYTKGTNIIEGKILWSMDLAGDARGAAIGDLNRDGMNEIVVTSSSGVYIFSQSGVELYNFKIKSNLASPAIGDIDGDGVNEAVIASGEDKKIYVISNGSLKEFSSVEWVSSNLALADLNGDGKLEIVAGDIYGSIYIWDYKGDVMEHDGVTHDEFTSAVVADLEGDGRKEIILGNDDAKIYVYTYMSSLTDTTPPVTTDNTDKQWHNSSITVMLVAEDSGSGVAATYYTIDGSMPTKDSIKGNTIHLSGDGNYSIKYFSIDKAGNVETVKNAFVKIDATPPATTNDSDDGWHNADVTLNLTASDSMSGIAYLYYTVDGIGKVLSSGGMEVPAITAQISFKDEGMHKVEYYSVDNAGNIEPNKTTSAKIDKSAPVTSDDTDGKWHNTDVTVKLTALDNLSGVKYTFSTYYTATPSADTLLEKFFSLFGAGIKESVITSKGENVYLPDEGMYDIHYYSEDNANNIETEKVSKPVKIDKTSPVTQATLSGTSGSSCYSTDVGVTLAANDAMSGVANMLYDMDGAGWMNYAGKYSISGEGLHLLKYRSVDNAGNNEVEHNMGFTIDKTPPEAIIRFDPVSRDIKVYNSETGGEEGYSIQYLKKYLGSEEDGDKGWEPRQYTLKDCADNSMVLVLKHKKEGKEVRAKVISMQYNGGEIIAAAKNQVSSAWSEEKKGAIKELEEKIEAEALFDAEAKYSAAKNQTEIHVKNEGHKEQKETRAGIAILELLTDRGGLNIRY